MHVKDGNDLKIQISDDVFIRSFDLVSSKRIKMIFLFNLTDDNFLADISLFLSFKYFILPNINEE